LAIKNAVGAKSVNDLPISIILSWFEQKSVAVILTLLSLDIKNIHIGPNPPAYITPEVMKILSDKYQLRIVSNPKEDLNRILGAQH
jgi:hydroxylamine reductase